MAKPNLRRYHHKIWLPDNTGFMCMDFFTQIKEVDVTYHAADQLLEDRRGIIPLPSRAELLHNTNTLVEVYERLDANDNPTGIIQKMLLRVHNLHPAYDYCYVLAREGFIVSTWANDKGDDHRIDKDHVYWRPKELAA